jgi:hypothetical protein
LRGKCRGSGQTTVRGGYQLSFFGRRWTFQHDQHPSCKSAGSSYQATITGGPGDLEYLDLTDLKNLIPVPVPLSPWASFQ